MSTAHYQLEITDNTYNPYNLEAVKSNFHRELRETRTEKEVFLLTYFSYLINLSHKAKKGFLNIYSFFRPQFSLDLKQTKYEYRYRLLNGSRSRLIEIQEIINHKS